MNGVEKKKYRDAECSQQVSRDYVYSYTQTPVLYNSCLYINLFLVDFNWIVYFYLLYRQLFRFSRVFLRFLSVKFIDRKLLDFVSFEKN